MNNYVIIPTIASACYGFLLITFLAAKKNNAINAFIAVLSCSLLWTAGSLLMRIHLFSLDLLWYNASICGLTFLAFSLYAFIIRLANLKFHISDYVLLSVGIIIFIINSYNGYFLKMPELIKDISGNEEFVYHTTWTVLFFVVYFTFSIIKIIVLITKQFIFKNRKKGALFPIILGLFILFLGHVLTIVPLFKGFPTDILSGIIFVWLLFYALYKKRMFKLDLLISKSSLYFASALISIIFLTNIIDVFLNLVSDISDIKSKILIIGISYSVFALILYRFLESFINIVYISDDSIKQKIIKDFQNDISSYLDIEDISRLIIKVVQNTLEIREVYYLYPNDDKQAYTVLNTSNPLNRININIRFDNPLIRQLNNGEEVLMEDFKQSNAYKSLWIDEKKELSYLNIQGFIPFVSEGKLISLLLLTEKKQHNKYTLADLDFLNRISIISSLALNKASLYKKAYNEARHDDLTKILNRKYFISTLSELYTKKPNEILSLAIINIDDFKLFNLLYGENEGDSVLIKIAKIIAATTNGVGFGGRYDSKVFICAFPKYDVNQTKHVVLNIQSQINRINSDRKEYKLKKVTVSCGISSIPFLANNPNELIKDAELAVYNVKRNGKNNIRISTGQQVRKNDDQVAVVHKSEIYKEFASTIYALTAAIDAKDHYTFSHSNNVAYYATELAYGLNMDEDSIEIIKEAALLHDIGKIGIDESILKKPGKLTLEEKRIMDTHVENSVNIIKHLPSLNYVIPAVIGHHENWDGTGYPRKIKGRDIPLFARILCIADCFDAMVSKRVYKEPRPLSYAISELEKGTGKQFDPELVPIFIGLLKSNKIKPITNN